METTSKHKTDRLQLARKHITWQKINEKAFLWEEELSDRDACHYYFHSLKKDGIILGCRQMRRQGQGADIIE